MLPSPSPPAPLPGPLPPPPPPAPAADLTGVCFRDALFLGPAGHLPGGALFEYFSRSPFYDRAAANEGLRAQGRHPLDLHALKAAAARKATIEYGLQQAQEPHLFVLQKQIRESAERATPVAVYYVLDGSVYQAPTLLGVIGSRMARSLHHIETAFKDCRDRLERLDKDKAGEEDAKSEEKRAAAEKAVDLREVLRVDGILASVFHKLKPVPAPPSALPGGGPPAHPSSGAAQGGAEPSSSAGKPQEGEAVQGPTKRLKTEH